MTDSIAAENLRGFVERVERLEEERAAIGADIREDRHLPAAPRDRRSSADQVPEPVVLGMNEDRHARRQKLGTSCGDRQRARLGREGQEHVLALPLQFVQVSLSHCRPALRTPDRRRLGPVHETLSVQIEEGPL